MSDTPFVGETYTIWTTARLKGAAVVGTTAGAEVRYELVKDGAAVDSGAATYQNSRWEVDILLPPSPGKLNVKWTVNALGAVGKKHQTIDVRAF